MQGPVPGYRAIGVQPRMGQCEPWVMEPWSDAVLSVQGGGVVACEGGAAHAELHLFSICGKTVLA